MLKSNLFRLLFLCDHWTYRAQYGTRGMFAQIKKHIGQKWPEYAENLKKGGREHGQKLPKRMGMANS